MLYMARKAMREEVMLSEFEWMPEKRGIKELSEWLKYWERGTKKRLQH